MGSLFGIGVSHDDKKRIACDNAAIMPGTPYRIDCDGRAMLWEEYGKNTSHGWHIDHATPTIAGGPDAPWNWRARHWFGNCQAGGRLAAIGIGNRLQAQNTIAGQSVNGLSRLRRI